MASLYHELSKQNTAIEFTISSFGWYHPGILTHVSCGRWILKTVVKVIGSAGDMSSNAQEISWIESGRNM